MWACLPGYNCLMFYAPLLHNDGQCKFNMLTIVEVQCHLFVVLKRNQWRSSYLIQSQSQHIWGHFELFCQIEKSSPYFLESCCAIPHTRLCVPVHLIYKRSIEICMRPMMPALKIHPNREYIDSFVIELSLSFPCHHSHGSLSRLIYYQTQAALLPLFLSGTYKLPTLLMLLVALVF